MADELIVTLPLPPRELSPNARCNWQCKMRLTKKYRGDAYLAARDAMVRSRLRFPFPAAVVQSVLYFAVRRRRDKDNYQASLKAAFDGLVDAGVLGDDSQLTPMPPRFEVDVGDPRVELYVEGRG